MLYQLHANLPLEQPTGWFVYDSVTGQLGDYEISNYQSVSGGGATTFVFTPPANAGTSGYYHSSLGCTDGSDPSAQAVTLCFADGPVTSASLGSMTSTCQRDPARTGFGWSRREPATQGKLSERSLDR